MYDQVKLAHSLAMMKSQASAVSAPEAGGGAVDGGDHRLGHGVQQRLRVVHALLAVPAVEADLAGRRASCAAPCRRCRRRRRSPCRRR